MAAAVLRSHDALNNRMHLDAFAPSPTRPRRRRSPRPSPAVPRATEAASPPAKTAAQTRRSPPPKAAAAARKHPSPTKEKRVVMEEVRILKRREEPPAPAPAPAAAANKRVVRPTNRTAAPRKVVSAADVAVYAGPAFASAPEPSSLPFPAFCLRRDAETEATRGLRCLLGIGQIA